MIRNDLPKALVDNPYLDQWVRIEPDGKVRFMSGKVELGQGVATALSQLMAEELDVDPARVVLVSGETGATPDEMFTAGSLTIEVSGAAVRLVGAEIRSIFRGEAAARLSCEPGELSVQDGSFVRGDGETGLSYWSLAGEVDLHRTATGSASPKPAGAFGVIGRSLPRLDLPAKIFGAGFIHDMTLPDMRHVRVLRQPWPGAQIEHLDPESLPRSLAESVEIVRTGDFAALLGRREEDVVHAWELRERFVRWTGGRPVGPGDDEPAALRDRPIESRTVERGEGEALPPVARTVRATYARPWLAHGSIGPSCALALFEDGRLTVWTHSQGVYPLRRSIASALGLDLEAVTVVHRQGAGCYGHNGADDAAFDAALVARERPGMPVRVLWMREDELGSSPLSPAMEVSIEVGLGEDGRPVTWTADILSPVHGSRPGMGGGIHLLAAQALPDAPEEPKPTDIPDAAGAGGARNAFSLYDIPQQRLVHRLVTAPPVRSSAMRGLGAFANVFAIEMMMDELAEAAGADPVAYRLSCLSDPRARQVVEAAAEMASWNGPGETGSGRGRGFAFSRYKNRAAYVAMVAEVSVDEEVRLERFWVAADAGLVVNPDGAVNQIEGGVIQAASWTVKERIGFGEGGVATNTWDQYPVLRFPEIPEIEVRLVGSAEDPSLGIGEVALGPTGAAIGNAVAAALGMRVRQLPLSRDRLMEALLAA